MDDLALAAACCIVRAHRASERGRVSHRSWPEASNELYWHTRELLASRASSMGLKLTQYIAKLSEAYSLYPESEVDRLSDGLWPGICHPELLVREVMET